jgi:hypothetical protein
LAINPTVIHSPERAKYPNDGRSPSKQERLANLSPEGARSFAFMKISRPFRALPAFKIHLADGLHPSLSSHAPTGLKLFRKFCPLILQLFTALKGQNIPTMGKAHRNRKDRTILALKGRNNSTKGEAIQINPPAILFCEVLRYLREK